MAAVLNQFMDASGAAIDLSHHASYTLEDDRLEPTNHPFNKDNDLCKPPWSCSMLVFRGVAKNGWSRWCSDTNMAFGEWLQLEFIIFWDNYAMLFSIKFDASKLQ